MKLDFFSRTLHSHPENSTADASGDQVPYQQPGLDYSIQRRDQVYSHMITSSHIHSA